MSLPLTFFIIITLIFYAVFLLIANYASNSCFNNQCINAQARYEDNLLKLFVLGLVIVCIMFVTKTYRQALNNVEVDN